MTIKNEKVLEFFFFFFLLLIFSNSTVTVFVTYFTILGKWFLKCHDLFVLLFYFPDLPQFCQLHCELCFSHPDSRCAELSNLQRITQEPQTWSITRSETSERTEKKCSKKERHKTDKNFDHYRCYFHGLSYSKIHHERHWNGVWRSFQGNMYLNWKINIQKAF